MLAEAYIKDKGRCVGPVFVPGEEYKFYINFDEPISDPSFANFRLDLMNERDQLTQAAVGTLTKDVIDPDHYNLIVTVNLPLTIRDGNFYFAIWDTVAAVQKARSSMILVANDHFQESTMYVAFRNKFDLNGIKYEQNPGFWNKLRLPLIQIDYQFEGERKQYRNVSNGKLRSIKNYVDEVATIESYWFSREMHRAASAMYDHDTIFMNNVSVTPKTAYQRENNQQSMISKGNIQVILDETIPVPEDVYTDITYRIETRDGYFWDSGRGYYVHR
jgi:hypothetical protein